MNHHAATPVVLLAAALLLSACNRNENASQQLPDSGRVTPQAREMAAGPARTGLTEGSLVYQDACASCHDTGILDAPVTGNNDAWADRLIPGPENLVQNVLLGIGDMPSRGGVPGLSDGEIAAAVNYMIRDVH